MEPEQLAVEATSVGQPSSQQLSSTRQLAVVAWGRGDMGQLALGSSQSTPIPTPIPALVNRATALAAGSEYTSGFVTVDGDLFMSGANDTCQLGVKGMDMALEPVRVPALESYGTTALALGPSHTLAVTDNGALASWGSNEYGQTGQGDTRLGVLTPKLIKGTSGKRFQRVAAGAAHSLALTAFGQVYSFGQGTFGALGYECEGNQSVPARVQRLWPLGVVQVACGENHSAALTVDGRLFTWGRNKYGQLGIGNLENATLPQLVRAAANHHGVQVACGGNHSLLLADDGAVLSWGRGTWGQLGHGTTDHQVYPRRIQALESTPVAQVSAGMQHSLALAALPDGRSILYAFGGGEQGQLGSESTGPSLLPTPLAAPNVVYVATGGDHNLAITKELQAGAIGDRPQWRSTTVVTVPPVRSLAEQAAQDPNNTAIVAELTRAVEAVYTTPGFLVAAFALPGNALGAAGRNKRQRQEQGHESAEAPSASEEAASVPPCGLDLEAAAATYQALLRTAASHRPQVVAALGKAAQRLLSTADKQLLAADSAKQLLEVMGLLWPQVLLLLLLNPLNSEGSSNLTRLLARHVFRLNKTMRAMLRTWLGALPPDVFATRLVRTVQRYLTSLVQHTQLRGRGHEDLATGLAFLHELYAINEAAGQRVSPGEFYNQALCSGHNLAEEYMTWVRTLDGGSVQQPGRQDALVSLYQVPEVLTPDAKSQILQLEALMQKRYQFQSNAARALSAGVHPALAGALGYLDLRIRRTHVLEDAVNQIINRSQDLKKPLRVTFISNGVEEEGVDQGGVAREFYQLLVRDLFSPAYGMFTYQESNRTFWFNLASLDNSDDFRLVGAILGLAIYNGIILDVHFPLVVYKKLLGLQTTFQDLRAAMPEVGRSLQQLLDYTGDVEAAFALTFEAEYQFFGELRTVELEPGGSRVAVTAANRARYVHLLTRWLLEDSIREQFAAFAEGFHSVCGGPALGLFRYEELELLVCGLPHLDFDALARAARYEGYSADAAVIAYFWRAIAAFNLDQKKRFLFFTTGSDRAPVAGLGALTLTIQRAGPDSDRLPTAHTCFNVLMLPEYSSYDKLHKMLVTAIENAEGFGLQ